MHGYNLARHTRGHLQVDVLTVGAPMWGDKNMIEATSRLVNQRNIVFVGDGAQFSTDMYASGDLITQYSCGPIMGCDALGTGPTGVRWPYARNAVQVRFCMSPCRKQCIYAFV